MTEQYPLAMLNEKYARLAPPKTFQDRMGRPVRATSTAVNGIFKKEANDAALAEMEDSFKRGGSLLIATLATLGATRRIIGVGEYLGFLTWFGAMAVTPKIINSLIWLKTGINLNEEYINTQGIREPLYKDNKYLPLHLIPDERMNFIADRIGIPTHIPDRRRLTEEKISQIAVQGRTWWMLTAGPATPVISGLLCDLFQDKAAGALNWLKRNYHLQVGLNQALSDKVHPEELARHMDLYLDQKVGQISNSQLSRWWKNFSQTLPVALGLKPQFRIKDIVSPQSRDHLVDKLAQTLEKMGQAADAQEWLKDSLEFLNDQKTTLQHLEVDIMSTLDQYAPHLGEAKIQGYRQMVEGRIMNATVTVTHYENLLKRIKGPAKLNPKEIRAFLEKPVLGEIQRLLETGMIDEARLFVGDEKLFQQVRNFLRGGRFQAAFDRLGAAPGPHLLQSLKDVMLRKLWRTKILGFLGGGLLLATGLYTYFGVGRNFGRQANDLPANFKRDWLRKEGGPWA